MDESVSLSFLPSFFLFMNDSFFLSMIESFSLFVIPHAWMWSGGGVHMDASRGGARVLWEKSFLAMKFTARVLYYH